MMKSLSFGLGCIVVASAFTPFACTTSTTAVTGVDASIGINLGDGGESDSGIVSECVPPTHGPTMHSGGSTADADETWTADTSPHILPYDHTIYKTVTIEPCAEVLIGEAHTLTVRGKLIAEGTPTKRIHLGGNVAGKPFATIHSAGVPLRFAYTTIDGGGDPLNYQPYAAGILDLQGDDQSPTQELLFVDHVDIKGSASNGLVLREGAGFVTGSNALTVTGSGQYPMSIFSRSVGGIPVGSYTGNAIDKILLPTAATDAITESTTLHARGVPYLAGQPASSGGLRVDVGAGKPAATLTIEAGVEVRFKKGGGMYITVASGTDPALGSLIAVGTSDKKIVFTSDEATPAPGDWIGLRFGEIPSAASKLDFALVEYAGGTSSSGSGSCPDNSELMNDAAIRISGAPSSQFVTHTEIVGSLTNGIDRGWRSDNPVIDFLPSNTFTNVALCNETYPPTAANVCPSVVPCPK